MHGAAAHSLADRFAWLFDGLCRAIGADAHRRRMEAALAWAVWNRVRLLGDRLIALAERVRAGKVAGRRLRTPAPRKCRSGGKSEPSATNVAATLPREFGWVTRVLPETAQFAGVFGYLLRDPEMAALVEQAPHQARRILVPLCQLLGVRPPAFPLRGAPARSPAPLEPAPAMDVVAAEPPATDERPAEPPAEQPPAPPALSPEEAARAYARRPGGFYFDGTGLRWS